MPSSPSVTGWASQCSEGGEHPILKLEKEYNGELLTLSSLLSLDLPDEPWVIDKLLRPGGVLLISARPKRGKSLIGSQILLDLAAGTPFLGRWEIPLPKRALYYQYEVTVRSIQERLQKQYRALKGPIRIDPIIVNKLHKSKTGTTREDVMVAATTHWGGNPPDVVIIDPLTYIYDGDFDENSAPAVKAVTDYLEGLAGDAALIVIHHNRKITRSRSGPPDMDSIRGSMQLSAWPNSLMVADWHGNPPDKSLLDVGIDLRDAPEEPPLLLQRDEDTLTYHIAEETVTLPNTEVEEHIEEVMDENPGIKRVDLVRILKSRFGVGQTKAYETIAKLKLYIDEPIRFNKSA